jgi:hypothetical protein
MNEHKEKKQSNLGPKPVTSRMKQNKGCVTLGPFHLH